MAVGPSDRVTDPRWPRLLSLTVHELRSPLTVAAGYLRMILKERAGPIPDQQRKLLEEADKSCARLADLLGQISELAQLEEGTVRFARSTVDLRSLATDAIAALPPMPDREVAVELRGPTALVTGDHARLKSALVAIVWALRRELVSDSHLVVAIAGAASDAARLTIGESSRIDQLEKLDPDGALTFDEWRGGGGLTLANARRIIEAHGGLLRAPAEDSKAAALIVFPAATR